MQCKYLFQKSLPFTCTVHLKLRKAEFSIGDQFMVFPIKNNATKLENTSEFQNSLAATKTTNYHSTSLQTLLPSYYSSPSIDISDNPNKYKFSMSPAGRQAMFKQPCEM